MEKTPKLVFVFMLFRDLKKYICGKLHILLDSLLESSFRTQIYCSKLQ